VQNVETLAQLALVARFGAAWFRALGSPSEPGTALVTLGGAVRRPGVYEVPLGLPLRALVERAGGAAAPLAAFLVGGYYGAWLPAETALGLRLLDEDLRDAGAALGARAIVALDAAACGLCESARVLRYLAAESAGQCGPCVYGLAAIASAFERLTVRGRGERDPRLERWLEDVRGRGACRHPDGAAQLAQSALAVFSADVQGHLRGRCRGDGRARLPLEPARAAGNGRV
jgi:NADH:ubiquinone oxidoreductase subunit F (NADH-binding)